MKRLLAVLLAGMMILCGMSFAEEDDLLIEETIGDVETEPAEDAAEDSGAEALQARASEPTLIEDPDNGRWEYHSEDLTVVIERFSEKYKSGSKRVREYCVAEIWASEASPLYPVMTEPTKKHLAGYKQVSPELLLEKANPIFAMSDDMYGIRWVRKYNYVGIVIRDGEIYSSKTRNSAKKRPWPNLDAMALYPDGSLKTFVCDELTAEQYLEQGATQVFSFGPVLISNGEINPQVLDPKYYPNNEPRVALGMVEPYHYIAVVVRGRPTTGYAGVHLDWLAQLMLDRGCVEALNLDGGLTSTMMFNGKIIETGGAGLRSQGSLICFGTRE